jgi:hypothetical protein
MVNIGIICFCSSLWTNDSLQDPLNKRPSWTVNMQRHAIRLGSSSRGGGLLAWEITWVLLGAVEPISETKTKRKCNTTSTRD